MISVIIMFLGYLSVWFVVQVQSHYFYRGWCLFGGCPGVIINGVKLGLSWCHGWEFLKLRSILFFAITV